MTSSQHPSRTSLPPTRGGVGTGAGAGEVVALSKIEATGNDFVVVDDVTLAGGTIISEPALAVGDRRALCDRHRGVGADGVLTVMPARAASAAVGASYRMHITNPDGSVPEMCGNGLRCVVLHLYRTGRIAAEVDVVVDTDAGPRTCRIDRAGTEVTIDMGPPAFVTRQFTPPWARVPLLAPMLATLLPPEIAGHPMLRGLLATTVSMGNPHLVLEAPRLPTIQEATLVGSALENLRAFFPERTNIEWVVDRVVAGETSENAAVDVVVWERGAGLTQACGTGACAVAAALVRAGRRQPGIITCHLPGGPLHIGITDLQSPIMMTGPVRQVFNAIATLPS